MHLSLHQLEVFVAVARRGSTRAAAGHVSRSQSAASMALAELEARVGRVLFDRVGRRLVLNAHGRALLPRAVALLEHAAELEAAMSGTDQTVMRLAASMTIGDYLLPPLLARWRREVPEAQLRLDVANTREVVAAVARLEADAGFVEGSVTGGELQVRPWLRDELVVFAAPGHPLARARAGSAQLTGIALILRESGSGTREAFDRSLGPRLGWPAPAMELGSSEAIKRVVADGDGVGCLSRHAVLGELASGRLVELRTTLPAPVRELTIVTHRDRRMTPHLQRFIDFCVTAGAAR
jgi:DNA-binding transcriptional LysR family regulator